jgi:hypothetical protein
MMKEYRITLDLIQSTENEEIYIKSDDVDSVKFIFEINNNGEIFDLTDATTTRLAIRRPSGFSFFQDLTITDAVNGLCEVILTTDAYSESGYSLGEVYITSSEIVQVTRQFEYKVLTSILAENTGSEGGYDGGVVYWNDILSKPTLFPPEIHTHTWLDITDKPLTFEPASHDHSWVEITNKPTTFTPSEHVHDWIEVANKPVTYPPSVHTHAYGDLTDIPTSFTPATHDHDWTEITNKPLTFDPATHRHGWDEIDGKPLVFAPDVHTHAYTSLTGIPETFTPSAHGHTIADVTGLQGELDLKLEAIPDEYLTQTEGDTRYELKGEGGTTFTVRTGTVDPTGLVPSYIGEIYINTTSKEAWIANSATGDWQTISKDELGDGASAVDWADVLNKPATFTPEIHTHTTADVTGLDTELANKADIGHAHAITDVTGLETELAGKSDEGHTHTTAEIANLDTTLAGKAEANHDHTWTEITEKPLTFPPDTHTHVWADLTDAPTEFTPTAHTHAITDVTNLQTALDNKADDTHTHSTADVTGLDTALTNKSDVGHGHEIDEVTNLQTTLDELDKKPLKATGAPTVTPEYVAQMYLDQATGDAYIANGLTSADWRLITNQQGSESVAWGSITGTIDNQTDLNEALNAKANTGHTHGTADITGLDTTLANKADTGHTHGTADITGLDTALNGKSDTGHTHATADITGLDTTLAGKSDTGHTHAYTELTNVPTVFTPESHAHAMTDVTGLDTALTGKSDTGHTHAYTELTGVPTTFTPESHTHLWTDITDTPSTFTPNLMSGTARGGAIVGSGLRMAGEYLTIREGTGLVIDSNFALGINKATTDGWYAKSSQGVTIWKGTQAEYDALGTYDDNTLYFIS